MNITEVSIRLADPKHNSRLLAYAEIVLDDAIAIHGAKVVKRHDGSLIVAMPSRRAHDRCPSCSEKTEFDQRYCGNCGVLLSKNRPDIGGQLHHDIVHPITAAARATLTDAVLREYSLALADAELLKELESLSA